MVKTSRGLLTYGELAPLLAGRVQRVQEAITRGDYDQAVPGRDLIGALHAAICVDWVPEWAGRWRSVAVVVGSHEPSLPHEVPLRMHDYEGDLGARLEALTDNRSSSRKRSPLPKDGCCPSMRSWTSTAA